MKQTHIPRLIVVAAGCIGAGAAHASGFQLLEQNASGLGNAYAGSAAVADNASTVFFNPAGMALLGKGGVSGGLAAIRPSFKFSDGGTTGPAGAPAGLFGVSGSSDPGDWGFVPNGYAVWAIDPDWTVGIGVGAPFGQKTEYESNTWVGSFQSIKFDIQTLNVNPSVAWRANDKLTLGFGINWQKFKAEYVARAPLGGFASGLATYKLDDSAWGWNAGLLYQCSKDTRIGLSYRSSIKYDLRGSLNIPLAGVSTGAQAKTEMPDTWTFSAVHTLDDRWELLGDIAWTGWSNIKKLTLMAAPVPTATLDVEYRDTWRVALGANYKLDNAWKLKLGMAYDQTPVPDAGHRPASQPDNNRTWFSIGAQYRVSPQATLDLGYTYLYLKDATVNNTTATATRGNLIGSYDEHAHLLGAQYSYSF